MVDKDTYKPPTDLWEARKMGNLDPFRTFGPGDPRNVNTHPGREDFSEKEFYNRLGVQEENGSYVLKADPFTQEGGSTGYDRWNILLCGHRGCGKSTELQRVAQELQGPEAFEIIYVDVNTELDKNNLQFNDVVLLLAMKLFEKLDNIPEVAEKINKVAYQAIEDWFSKIVKDKITTIQELVETTASAGAGFNYFGFLKLWMGIKAAFKFDSQEKQVVRAELTKYFSTFTLHFNTFLTSVRNALQKTRRAKDILFIVDGTDKIPTPEEATSFFVNSVGSFYSLEARFIYTAPVDFAYDNIIKNHFKIIVLPMLTVIKRDGEINIVGKSIMTELVLRRLDISVFENEKLIEDIVCYSGGCPRQVVRVLNEAAISTPENEMKITRAAFDKARKKIAVEFRRGLVRDQYELLIKFVENPEYVPSAEEDNIVKNLLFRLALMEYNSYWRAPNPAIRDLDEFKEYTKNVCPSA